MVIDAIKWGIGGLVIGLIIAFASRYVRAESTVTPGTVIILNGPSGSGKTSIQKNFQHLMMPKLWIKLGIDSLFDGPLPDITLENLQYWQSSNPLRWVETTTDDAQHPVITLFVGSEGERVVHGMHSAIAAYAKQGCNVIVDYIAYKKEWVDDLRNALKDIPTYWVKVNISLEELEKREAARGTSPQGHARSHYYLVYWDIAYDLEVDSGTQTAAHIAQRIKEHWKL